VIGAPDDADEPDELPPLHAARALTDTTAIALSAAAFLETGGNTGFMPTASNYRVTLVFFCPGAGMPGIPAHVPSSRQATSASQLVPLA
jgi:hypothetical protein